MVKVKLNRILVEAHGKVDDLVFRRTRNGGMSLIRRADMSKVKWSPAQAENRRRFGQAIALDQRDPEFFLKSLECFHRKRRGPGNAQPYRVKEFDQRAGEYFRKFHVF